MNERLPETPKCRWCDTNCIFTSNSFDTSENAEKEMQRVMTGGPLD